MSVFIVAEMSCNHMGDFGKAIQLIDASADAGADAVKISLDNPDGGITINHDSKDFRIESGLWQGQTLHELYTKTRTPWDWLPDLQNHAFLRGIELFATVSCIAGVEWCEAYDMPRYKVSSYEACDIPLIREIMKTGKPIIVSCGMDWHDAWDELQGYDASFLYCVSKYPAYAEDFDLNACAEFAGISDHSCDDAIVFGAVTRGAKIVERHIMLDGDKPPDYWFSDVPEDFREMVIGIRSIESAMMPKQFKSPDKQFCKSLYAVEDIAKGEQFTSNNVRAIRPGNGMHPREYFRVVGAVAKCDIKRGTAIVEAML